MMKWIVMKLFLMNVQKQKVVQKPIYCTLQTLVCKQKMLKKNDLTTSKILEYLHRKQTCEVRDDPDQFKQSCKGRC